MHNCTKLLLTLRFTAQFVAWLMMDLPYSLLTTVRTSSLLLTTWTRAYWSYFTSTMTMLLSFPKPDEGRRENKRCDSRNTVDGLIVNVCVCVRVHSLSLANENFPDTSVFLARLSSLQQEPSELQKKPLKYNKQCQNRSLFRRKNFPSPVHALILTWDWRMRGPGPHLQLGWKWPCPSSCWLCDQQTTGSYWQIQSGTTSLPSVETAKQT